MGEAARRRRRDAAGRLMLGALLDRPAGPLRVLAIGSHADDIELGCGGTLLALAGGGAELEVTWVVLGADGARADEARSSAGAFLTDAAAATIVVEAFRDGFFPYVGGSVKERFEALKAEVSPDVIFTHTGGDLHQDHRLVAELTWNTFRDHLILEYEIPKYDADLGQPNVYFPLPEAVVDRKISLLLEHFPSQRSRHWFTDDLFRALMRLRGMEGNSPTRYAEAFRCRKLVLTR
jgi:LmbE family N-acetylglucosaminyl deacetylase